MMSHAMTKHLTLALQIEEWTREAVALCGSDWKHISSYIQDRFAEMEEPERARFEAEARMTLLDPTAGASRH